MSGRGSLRIDPGSRRSARLGSRITDSRERDARPVKDLRNESEMRGKSKSGSSKKRGQDVTEDADVQDGRDAL